MPASNPKLCTICLVEYPEEFFPVEKLTEMCTHALDMCLSCLAESIKSQQSRKMWNQISCPTCTVEKKTSILSNESIQKYADQLTWERYDIPNPNSYEIS